MQLPVSRAVGVQIHEAQRQVPEIDQTPIRPEERRLRHVRVDVGIECGQHLVQPVGRLPWSRGDRLHQQGKETGAVGVERDRFRQCGLIEKL